MFLARLDLTLAEKYLHFSANVLFDIMKSLSLNAGDGCFVFINNFFCYRPKKILYTDLFSASFNQQC